MSRKLFTKIYEARPQEAESAAHELIKTILSKSHNTLQDKHLNRINTIQLKKEVMHHEVENIRQAYVTNPVEELIPEDSPAVRIIRCRRNQPQRGSGPTRHRSRESPSSRNDPGSVRLVKTVKARSCARTLQSTQRLFPREGQLFLG